MNITTNDGKTIDSDKLDDIQALVAEKSQEMVDLFVKYKIPFYMRVILPGDRFTGAFNFEHAKYTPNEAAAELAKDCMEFWEKQAGDGSRFVLMDRESFEALMESK